MALTLGKNIPNAEGLKRVAVGLSGTYTASTVVAADNDGAVAVAAGVMTIKTGFVPQKVMVNNYTSRITQEWSRIIPAGNFMETAANGTRTLETDGVAANVSVNTTTGDVTIVFSGGIVVDNGATLVEIFEG